MKKFTPDYSNESKKLPAGTYKVVVTGFTEKTSKHNAPMIEWDLKTVDSNQFDGECLRHYTVVSGFGSEHLNRFLRAIDPSYLGDAFYAEDYVDKMLNVSIVWGNAPDGRPSKFPRISSVSPCDQDSSNCF